MIFLLRTIFSFSNNTEYRLQTAEAPLRYLTLQEGKIRLTIPTEIENKRPYLDDKFTLRFGEPFNENTNVQIIFAPQHLLCRNDERSTNILTCEEQTILSAWRFKYADDGAYQIIQNGKCLYIDKYDEEHDGYYLELYDCKTDDIKQQFKFSEVKKEDGKLVTNDNIGTEESYYSKKKKEARENKTEDPPLYNKTSLGGNFEAGTKDNENERTRIMVGLAGYKNPYSESNMPEVDLLEKDMY
ncbi:hypothetical protein GVAV_001372 [Gurleya vavrai]